MHADPTRRLAAGLAALALVVPFTSSALADDTTPTTPLQLQVDEHLAYLEANVAALSAAVENAPLPPRPSFGSVFASECLYAGEGVTFRRVRLANGKLAQVLVNAPDKPAPGRLWLVLARPRCFR